MKKEKLTNVKERKKVRRPLSPFDIVLYILLTIVLFVTLYPLYFTLIASVSDINAVSAGRVWFIPVGFNLDGYRMAFMADEIWMGYFNSIIYTVFGTLLSLSITIPAAFALSHKSMLFRRPLMGIFIFTMYFSGGLIPTFILVRQLGMFDTRMAMIVPGALSVFFLIIARTYYETSIPTELYEAAKIDGTSTIGTFFRIALPLSRPIIAVIALFYAVGRWNSFFDALIYLTQPIMYPLQLVLRNIVILNQNIDWTRVEADRMLLMLERAQMAQQLRFALIFIASAPLLIAYPFVQKFFVKGVMIGAVKG